MSKSAMVMDRANGSLRDRALVSTDWVEAHRGDPGVVLVEVDVDTTLYDEGHIPGAVGWSWKTQLSDPLRRDVLSRPDMQALLSSSGVEPETALVLYGDSNNWFAAWAFWQLAMYGHKDIRIMDGGRKKWIAEGRPLTKEVPEVARTDYDVQRMKSGERALLDDVRQCLADGTVDLVDVRSPAEFSGEILAPPGLPETCQRGGHIPGARNIPWSEAVEDDGTFRSNEALRELYAESGIAGDRPIITYCRIGERSSHTWFVLRYLLEYEDVRNYDGSWTEWGNLVAAPIGTGHA